MCSWVDGWTLTGGVGDLAENVGGVTVGGLRLGHLGEGGGTGGEAEGSAAGGVEGHGLGLGGDLGRGASLDRGLLGLDSLPEEGLAGDGHGGGESGSHCGWRGLRMECASLGEARSLTEGVGF